MSAALTVVCCAAGALTVWSLEDTAQYVRVTSGGVDMPFAIRQSVYIVLGLAAMLAVGRIEIQKLTEHKYIVGAVGVLPTLLTFTSLGVSAGGSDDRAWLAVGGYTFQPSEILKVCFIITFAAHITALGKRIDRPLPLLGLLLHAAVPTALVYFQGDQGTAVIFLLIAAVMLFAAGLSFRYAAVAVVISPLIAWSVWTFLLKDHQKERILVLLDKGLDPLGTGFQQRQSAAALQNGGLLGRGLFSAGDEKLVYVSQSQNDFVFSYIGQTLGFVGCAAVLILLFSLCMRIAACSGRGTKEENLVSAGVFALLFSHTLINTGMVLGFLPVIGVPLPFFSAGGSACISMCAAVGLVRTDGAEEECRE